MNAKFERLFQPIAALGIRGLSVLAGFIISLMIGRMFGPVANGQYALVAQTGMFLSVLAVGGLDLAATREFSAAPVQGLAIARRSLLTVLAISMTFAAIVIAILIVGGPALHDRLLTVHRPPGALLALSVILVSRALTRMLSAILRSQRAYIIGQSIEVLVIPVVVILIVIAGLATSVEAILRDTAIVGLATGIVAILLCLRFTRTSGPVLDVPISRLMRRALPLWGVAIALNVADWYGLAVAANILGIADAGRFRVASQIGGALSIIGMGLFSVYSPQIGAAHAADDRRKIGALTRTATRLSLAFSVPLAIVVAVAADPILRLFGPGFADASDALRIFTIGQAVYAMTGPAGITLAMTGHERSNLAITTIGTLTLFATAPLGAYFGGLAGLASGIVIALIGRNIASVIAVYRLEGINVMTGSVRPLPKELTP